MIKFQIKEFNFTPKATPWVSWTATQITNPCAEISLDMPFPTSDIILSITRSGQENLRNLRDGILSQHDIVTLDYTSRFI